VPYAFGGRAGWGLPRLHGLEQVLRPSASSPDGRSVVAPGGGRTAVAAPVGPAVWSAFGTAMGPQIVSVPGPLAGVVGAPFFGAIAPGGPYGAPGYGPPLGAQEWTFLLASLQPPYGDAR